jgi:hypothetical protein
VTTAVWDAYGGTPHTRMVRDIAATLDELGLVDVEQTSLLIRIEFLGFDDYWLPLISEGPVAKFVAGLYASAHATLVDHVRRAYLANLPDGPRSFACVAWACRGRMPS